MLPIRWFCFETVGQAVAGVWLDLRDRPLARAFADVTHRVVKVAVIPVIGIALDSVDDQMIRRQHRFVRVVALVVRRSQLSLRRMMTNPSVSPHHTRIEDTGLKTLDYHSMASLFSSTLTEFYLPESRFDSTMVFLYSIVRLRSPATNSIKTIHSGVSQNYLTCGRRPWNIQGVVTIIENGHNRWINGAS